MRKVRLRYGLILAAALGLAACGGGTPNRFSKEGASLEEFNRDAYDCERDTRMSAASFGRGLYADEQASDFAIRCMMARGWSYGRFLNGFPA